MAYISVADAAKNGISRSGRFGTTALSAKFRMQFLPVRHGKSRKTQRSQNGQMQKSRMLCCPFFGKRKRSRGKAESITSLRRLI